LLWEAEGCYLIALCVCIATGGGALFFPVIDGDIIPDMPLKILQNGSTGDYDLLIGYNTDEMNTFSNPYRIA
jgi:carboxylesterase type B